MTESRDTKDTAPRSKRSWVFPLIIVGIITGGLLLVVQSSTAGGAYDMTIKELMVDIDSYVGKEVRVTGVVQAGSFREGTGDDIDIKFNIADAEGNVLKVTFKKLLPDAFEEGRNVIVLGTLRSREEIDCSRLTVMCPSKYKDENKAGAGADLTQK